jgi:(E)-4-hydroxy-3-methylbut-2-enyl-diphosphate synthase
VSQAYCPDPYRPLRRRTRVVRIGDVLVGGDHPVVVQSMTTTDTLDVAATVRQTLELAEAGSQLVRITAPTVKAARALGEIRSAVRAAGCTVPLVADIHFQPGAAMEAVKHVEKVRVNPGNYVDSKAFRQREYTDEEYAAEVRRVQERFRPLVLEAKARGVALRVGTNHGSLSDRIMNRWGDTPQGMVESAVEFLEVCEQEALNDVVLSMKASNPQVMIQAYRLLAARLAALGWDHPFHLGVTEAGEGEDGRIKSAIGIGSLLRDGIGETVRVSLTESPVAEIPVATRLVELCTREHATDVLAAEPEPALPYDPFAYTRRESEEVPFGVHRLGGDAPVLAMIALQEGFAARDDAAGRLERLATPAEPGLPALEGVLVPGADADHADDLRRAAPGLAVVVDDNLDIERRESCGGTAVSLRKGFIGAYRELAGRPERTPIIVHVDVPRDPDDAVLVAASVAGPLLADGIGDALRLGGPHEPERLPELTLSILQSARLRSSRTEYIACPGCGRTLFDLETTTQRIKARTGHLPGVKIAVMGCIVNGPGEMADADFGYVGSAPGYVNLYAGKEIVVRNVPEGEADERLIDLLRDHGVWREPVAKAADAV